MRRYKYILISLLLSSIVLPVLLEANGETSPSSSLSLSKEETIDALIIGGGVGGLTSAVYLSRAGLHPVVISGPEVGGALAQSPLVQNWPGEQAISGNTLTDKIREQAISSGAVVEHGEVVDVDFSSQPFKVIVKDPTNPKKNRVILAKICIIATGASANTLSVPGENKYWLHGIHTCAVCDGNFYQDKNVVVVGGGDGAIMEAHYLAKIAKKVTLLVRGPALRSIEVNRKTELMQMPNVEILYNTTVQEVRGDETTMHQVVIQTKPDNKTKTLSADGLFLAIGNKPTTALFEGKIELDDKGYVVLHNGQETSVSGVYAVGDVCDPIYRQAVTAASDGTKAALQAERMIARTDQPIPVAVQKESEKEAQIIAIKSVEQFEQEVLRSETPVIVDFYADWCGPCRALEPHINTWSRRLEGKIKFAKVNIDHLNKLAARYRVRALPTVLYFEKGGVLVDSRTGMQEIAGLIDSIELD